MSGPFKAWLTRRLVGWGLTAGRDEAGGRNEIVILGLLDDQGFIQNSRKRRGRFKTLGEAEYDYDS